jgi:hypothetical protein
MMEDTIQEESFFKIGATSLLIVSTPFSSSLQQVAEPKMNFIL